MISRLARRTGILAATAAVVLGSASAASAASWTHADPSGDVRVGTESGTSMTVDATNTRTDVVRFSAWNTRKSVIVKVRTRTSLPADNFGFIVDIKTARARYEAVKFNVGGFSGTVLTHGTKEVACKGLHIRVDRSTHTAQATVPRSCIGTPGSVRVGAGVFTETTSTTNEDDKQWQDDALRSDVGSNLFLSPWIKKA